MCACGKVERFARRVDKWVSYSLPQLSQADVYASSSEIFVSIRASKVCREMYKVQAKDR